MCDPGFISNFKFITGEKNIARTLNWYYFRNNSPALQDIVSLTHNFQFCSNVTLETNFHIISKFIHKTQLGMYFLCDKTVEIRRVNVFLLERIINKSLFY